MTVSPEKSQALQQIASIAEQYHLTRSDILAAFETTGADAPQRSSTLQKALTYLGGALVFVGIAIYTSIIWDDLGSLSRVILTLGTGFVAFILGLLSLGDKKYYRAATPLFLIACALEPTGLFVFMDEYLPPSNDLPLAASLVFGFMLVQQALAFFSRRKTSLLFFTLFFFYSFMMVVMDKIDIDPRASIFTLGLSGLLISWAVSRGQHARIAPFYFFISSVAIVTAAYDIFARTSLDILLIGVSVSLTLLSTRAHSKAILTVSMISLFAYIAYFTDHYFKDLVAWPVALIGGGLLMMGLGAYTVKLSKKIDQEHLNIT